VPDFFRGRKWDLVGLRNLWFALSLLIIIPGVVAYFSRGLNKGIDFTGGGLVTYQLSEPVRARGEADTLARARQAIAPTGIEAQLQLAGAAGRIDQLLVRTRIVSKAGQDSDAVLTTQQNTLRPALKQAFPGLKEMAGEMVSPVVSQELITRAIWAVALGCIFILVWIRIRYPSFQWSACAIIALMHDVLVLTGVFALTQKEVNTPFVAAALTVVGFSVHDTIIIFDRIRENLRLRKGGSFAETANISLLETMPRSVNTVLTVELVLIALYLLGGASLRDFTFAMIVGITIGAYSSIFNAAQLLVVMRNREERRIAARRATGRPTREMAERAGSPRRPRPMAPRALRQVATEAAEEEVEPISRPASSEDEPADELQGEETAESPAATQEQAARSARRKMKAGRKRKRRF
jgi:preprotein translocase subunit SecF